MAVDARRSAEFAARSSYGRLLAILAARTGDVAAAEDALGDAFAAALRRWPVDGVPDNPDAWLLQAARRVLVDGHRRRQTAAAGQPTLTVLAEELGEGGAGEEVPDRRLALLFVCAHPAIDAGVRTPLMLQTVLGLDAARIASAFLVAPSTMAQRLVRAKTRIREAGIPFGLPERREWPPRLEAVLACVYAAFTASQDDAGGGEGAAPLAEEAIWLGRLLSGLLPDEPEAKGLLALMLHVEARRASRRSAAGAYVPLAEQDVRLWDGRLIAEAEAALGSASKAGRPGRYQLEAAIQSAHATSRGLGQDRSEVDPEAIALLYEGLVRVAPTIGAGIGRAAALANARSAEEGWEALAALDAGIVAEHQPYWAARADLARRTGRGPEAAEAYARAIGLTRDPAVRAFLAERLRAVAPSRH